MPKFIQFTDIHLGRRNNSAEHLQDCEDYVDWMLSRAKSEKVDGIIFLGDFFENRSAINVVTLNVAYRILKKIDDFGLPVHFLVGNHDLGRRNTRELYSTSVFSELKNFTLYDSITQVGDLLFVPFLFDHEYPDLAKACATGVNYVFGHLEFAGFAITGYNKLMEHGPSHKPLSGVKTIFSGHFHKRQAKDNVVFIGNCFPMDHGDVDDDDRGACVVDTDTDDIYFLNWEDCPKYRKFKLSEMADQNLAGAKIRAKCQVDVEVEYSELQSIREMMKEDLQLRDFVLEDCTKARAELLAGSEADTSEEIENIDQAVIEMLRSVKDETIDGERLAKIYMGL